MKDFLASNCVFGPKKAILSVFGQKMTIQAVEQEGASNFNVSKATPGCGQQMLFVVQVILVANKHFHNSSIEKTRFLAKNKPKIDQICFFHSKFGIFTSLPILLPPTKTKPMISITVQAVDTRYGGNRPFCW